MTTDMMLLAIQAGPDAVKQQQPTDTSRHLAAMGVVDGTMPWEVVSWAFQVQHCTAPVGETAPEAFVAPCTADEAFLALVSADRGGRHNAMMIGHLMGWTEEELWAWNREQLRSDESDT